VAGAGPSNRARGGNQGGAEYGAPASPPVRLSRGPPPLGESSRASGPRSGAVGGERGPLPVRGGP